MVYIPNGTRSTDHVPIAVVFTPDGKIKRTLAAWEPAASRFHWLVYASTDYSNAAAAAAPDFDQFTATTRAHISAAIAALPADSSRVVLSGFSGGGAFALHLNETYPGLAAALIDNAGGSDYLFAPPGFSFPTSEFAGSRRIAVFLSSPADHRFGSQATLSQQIYAGAGWDTHTVHFAGGHVEAPASVYSNVVAWIVSQPSWA
jgi:predicted esterase